MLYKIVFAALVAAPVVTAVASMFAGPGVRTMMILASVAASFLPRAFKARFDKHGKGE